LPFTHHVYCVRCRSGSCVWLVCVILLRYGYTVQFTFDTSPWFAAFVTTFRLHAFVAYGCLPRLHSTVTTHTLPFAHVHSFTCGCAFGLHGTYTPFAPFSAVRLRAFASTHVHTFVRHALCVRAIHAHISLRSFHTLVLDFAFAVLVVAFTLLIHVCSRLHVCLAVCTAPHFHARSTSRTLSTYVLSTVRYARSFILQFLSSFGWFDLQFVRVCYFCSSLRLRLRFTFCVCLPLRFTFGLDVRSFVYVYGSFTFTLFGYAFRSSRSLGCARFTRTFGLFSRHRHTFSFSRTRSGFAHASHVLVAFAFGCCHVLVHHFIYWFSSTVCTFGCGYTHRTFTFSALHSSVRTLRSRCTFIFPFSYVGSRFAFAFTLLRFTHVLRSFRISFSLRFYFAVPVTRLHGCTFRFSLHAASFLVHTRWFVRHVHSRYLVPLLAHHAGCALRTFCWFSHTRTGWLFTHTVTFHFTFEHITFISLRLRTFAFSLHSFTVAFVAIFFRCLRSFLVPLILRSLHFPHRSFCVARWLFADNFYAFLDSRRFSLRIYALVDAFVTFRCGSFSRSCCGLVVDFTIAFGLVDVCLRCVLRCFLVDRFTHAAAVFVLPGLLIYVPVALHHFVQFISWFAHQFCYFHTYIGCRCTLFLYVCTYISPFTQFTRLHTHTHTGFHLVFILPPFVTITLRLFTPSRLHTRATFTYTLSHLVTFYVPGSHTHTTRFGYAVFTLYVLPFVCGWFISGCGYTHMDRFCRSGSLRHHRHRTVLCSYLTVYYCI